MPPELYRVKTVLICDDVRREITGKDILIGVYNDVVVSRQFPFTLPRLVFRLHIEGLGNTFSTFNFSVTDSKDEAIFEVSGKVGLPDPKSPIILVMQAEGLTLQKADAYSINMGLDRPAAKVWEFEARLPKDSVEQERFKMR